MRTNGANALENGLGPLPQSITPATTFPLAHWKTATFAQVMSLGYAPDADGIECPQTWHHSYERVDGDWRALRGSGGGGWYGALGPPGSMHAPDGRSIWWGMRSDDADAPEGRPKHVVAGWHTPEVAQIRLVQVGGTEICEANGHYGAWIIGTERHDPWTIEARDGSGQLVDSIEGPRLPETPIEVIQVPEADWPHSSSGQMEILTIERYENSVKIDWAFRFHGDTEAHLTTESKARLEEDVRAKSFDSPAERNEYLESRSRLCFVLQLTIADDLGTDYVHESGGGSTGSPLEAVAKWKSRFRPSIPDGASVLLVRNGDMEISAPLQ